MKTAISELVVRRPTTLTDALRIMREEPCTPIAGATDLYVSLNFGTLTTRRFIDVWSIKDLQSIRVHDDHLVIGATVPYTKLMQSSVVAERLPMLGAAASQIGGPQIQNRGTLGGNIANASPAGDSLPVLMASNAIVVLASVDGERRVPLSTFYTGYRTSVMQSHELITAVEIPAVTGQQWFRKVGTRAAQAISKLAMAAVRNPEPRIALGSVAPTVIRAWNTERALAAGADIDEAANILVHEIKPIDDIRSTAAYRSTVAAKLLRQFWRETA